MLTSKQPTREEWTRLILLLAFLLGFLVRLFPDLLVRFPLNDGGLFFSMSRDLRANGFRIPAFTSYNDAGIPFAYPPLGFYAAAFLGAVGLPELQVFVWLPLLISTLAIPAFYLLARTFLNDNRPEAAVATMIFALVPGNYGQQIMGGGVTRAFGVLFYILAIWSVYQMLHSTGWKYIWLSILFCSLAVLSHPEITLATAAGCVLLCVFYMRGWRKVLSAGLVAASVLVLSAPWWATVLLAHGLTPWLSVANSGDYGTSPLSLIYADFLAPASLFSLAGLLRIMGMLIGWRKRYFFLLAWMFLPYIVEPRSAWGIAYFASCLFVALGLTEVLPWIVDWIIRRRGFPVPEQDFTQRTWLGLVLFGIMLFWFVLGTFFDFSVANGSLKPPYAQETFAWVKDHTPEDSRFLILTGNPEGLMSEPVVEWFPTLAERRSQTTPQGEEWTLGADFFPRLDRLKTLHECITTTCVENWAAETNSDYNYVLISRTPLTRDLLASFDQDRKYNLVYENPRYAVYLRME